MANKLTYTETYIQSRDGSYQGDINNGVTFTSSNDGSELVGFQNKDGDVISIDLGSQKPISYVRVYYSGTGYGGVTHPNELYVIVNGIKHSITDFSAETFVGSGYWADIYYIDIPVSDISDTIVFGFVAAGSWTMFTEIEVYDSTTYTISGKTLENGVPTSCTVRLYRANDGALVQDIQSDANGDYTFTVADNTTEYYIVCIGSPSLCVQANGMLTATQNQ